MLLKSLTEREKGSLVAYVGTTEKNFQHYIKPRRIPNPDRIKKIISWFENNQKATKQDVLAHFFGPQKTN